MLTMHKYMGLINVDLNSKANVFGPRSDDPLGSSDVGDELVMASPYCAHLVRLRVSCVCDIAYVMGGQVGVDESF